MEYNISKSNFFKILTIFVIIIISIVISYSVLFIFKTEKVYFHFFYIPIIFSAFWWGYRSFVVPVLLSVLMILIYVFSPVEIFLWVSFFRISMFFLIFIVVSSLVQNRKKLFVKLNETNNLLNKEIIKRKKTEEKLITHKNNLEELVKERTEEIETINEELISSNEELCVINVELIESNDRLNMANKELEEFNQLFIDREFRIKELRDRIKELEGKK